MPKTSPKTTINLLIRIVSFQIALTESPSFLSIVVVHPCSVCLMFEAWNLQTPYLPGSPVAPRHGSDLKKTFLYNAWMVKDSCCSSVPVLVWKCTGWFRSNCLEEKVQDSACITLTHLWYYTKNCSHKASWARLQRSRALMFQQISMQSGVLSKVCQSLKESLH